MMVYTDGGCKNYVGGWAWAVVEDGKIITHGSGMSLKTTNQRMEMQAIINAIDTLSPSQGEIEIVTDSAYVQNCFDQRWYMRWLANGWKTYTGRRVKNRDLWERLLKLYFNNRISFTHVDGHSGNKFNDFVDGLCTKEIGEGAGRGS